MHFSMLNKYFSACDMLLFSNTCSYFPAEPEIIAVIEGTVSLTSDIVPLKTGSIAFIPPSENIFEIHEHCIILRIRLNPQSLLHEFPMLFEFPQKICVIKNTENLFASMINYARSVWLGYNSPFRTPTLYFYILDILDKNIVHSAEQSLTVHVSDILSEKQSDFVRQLIQFANNHFMENIGLSDVSACFHKTPQYIAGIFKRGTGMTFRNYLLTLRAKKALAYIKYTELSVEETSAIVHLKQHDFPAQQSTSAPKRISRHIARNGYAILNAATALTYTTNTVSNTDPYTEISNQYTVTIGQPTGGALYPVWKQLINLGYAINFDNSQMFHQLIKIQENIGFRYGRICRIFDLITSYRKGKHILYDYNRIFRIFDALVKNHMYPFIELGNKRLRIQLTLLESLIPDIPETFHEYFEFLLKILPGFICACINRYGYDSISNWKFEISAPSYESVDENVDFSIKLYIEYFNRIKNCIHKYVPECQVGGPGFNDWGSPELFKNFLTSLRSDSVEFDFLTAYLYPLYKKESSMKLSGDPDLLEHRMNTLQHIISHEYPQMQLWITEFNSNLSSRNFLNDSSYQAAFITHTLFAAIRQKISALGYYLMSDTPLRYADTLDMLFGGWGLFTDTSIPKPSYHTWYMFSKLGTHIAAKVKNCIITATSPTNYQCILYHYENLSSNYVENNVEKTDFLSPDQLFIHIASDYWELIFNNLPSGYYLIKEYCISPDCGNILFEWYNLHFLTPVKNEDIELLRRLSDLHPSLSCVKVTDDSPLFLHQTLSRQEIKLITLDYFEPLDNYSERTDNFHE